MPYTYAVTRCCTALLYGRAGHVTAQNGGFRPGQAAKCKTVTAGQVSNTPELDQKLGKLQLSMAVRANLHLLTSYHTLVLTDIFGASISEATMRPNPRCAGCSTRSAAPELTTTSGPYRTRPGSSRIHAPQGATRDLFSEALQPRGGSGKPAAEEGGAERGTRIYICI